MGLMDFFKKKNSGNVAKDRLKLLLVSERADCSPEIMDRKQMTAPESFGTGRMAAEKMHEEYNRVHP